MKRVTLLNLETLCWISRLGTFHAAAEKMNASQSAVSARIRDIESSLGVTLFRRQGRRMELTYQGRELVQMVEPLLRRLSSVVTSLDNPETATGTVRIAVGEVVALSWFPGYIARLRKLMPKVVFDIDVNLSVSMRERLEAGKLDVAMFAGPAGLDTRSASLGSVRMGWMMAPSLRGSHPNTNDLAEVLRASDLWALSKPSATYSMTMSMLEDLNVDTSLVGNCNDVMSLLDIIAGGAGVALLPEVLVRKHVARGDLMPVLPDMPMPELEFHVAWNGDQENQVIRNVVDLALQSTTFDMLASAKHLEVDRPSR